MRKMLIALLAIVPLSIMADDTNGAEKEFTMDGEFGLIITSGNTKTKSAKGKINAHQELEMWSNDYVLEAFYKRDEVRSNDELVTKTTAQKIFFSGQGNYKLTNPDYRLFLFGSYEDDRFSGFDYQSTIAAGWDHQVWKEKVSSFSYSIGPGYSFAEKESGEDASGFILRGAMDYKWKISDTSTFRQLLSTEVGAENTKSKSETSLTAKINGSLAMKVSLILNHNSEVAENKKNLDSQTAVTLVYTFF